MDQRNIELEQINEKISKIKNISIDNFHVGNYVDSLDEAKTWCLAEITMRNGDVVRVHYEGWSSKFDEVVNIKKINKINHFRRYSRGYTGQKRNAYRDYIYNENDFISLKTLINDIKDNEFKGYDPLLLTQIVRGRIFTYLDIFMTNSSKESDEFIIRLVDLIYDFIDFSIQYFIVFKNNLHLVEILDRYPDIFLVDEKMSVLACYYEIIICLKRIFGRDERVNSFYKNYNDIILKQTPKSSLNILNENTVNMNTINKSNVYSKSAGNFINYFAEKKGFELVRDIILYKSGENGYLPLNMLESYLNVYSFVEPLIDYKTTLNIEINQFREMINNRLSNLNEYEIKETNKKTIQNICRSIQQIFFYDQSNCDKYYEELILIYNFKCLCSKNLEKRIKGITSINNILDYIEKGEGGYETKADENELEENIVWLTNKTLLYNLKEKNILNILLGEQMHEEILKRASAIFKLFAKFNQLNSNVYDLLLTNCFEKHETIGRQIENIICDLSIHLVEQDRVYIFNKIKEVGLDKYDLNFLNFVKNYSSNCIGGYSNEDQIVQTYGIPLLWKYLQDDKDSKVQNKNVESLETCVQFLHDLLIERNIPLEIIEAYLKNCIENTNNNQSVVQSLNLISKCIETISRKNEGEKNEKFLQSFDKNLNLVHIVVKDLSRYMNDHIIERRNVISESNSESLLNYVFEGYFSHRQNIETRLNLIYIIITEIKYSQLDNDYSFLLDLWDTLCLKSVHESESIILFRFFHKKQEGNDMEDAFSSQIAEFLFTKILINESLCNYSKVSHVGALLFMKYFKILNRRLKKITIIRNNYIRVNNCDNILGFDSIWNILISTSHELILGKFAKLLVELCIYFKVINEDFCINYWKNYYFTKMFDKLKECRSTNNENGIKAILTLIKLLIKTINEGGEIPSMDEVNYVQSGIEYVFYNKEKNSKREIKVTFTETVFSVRQKISFFFDICLDKLCFRIQNKRFIDFNDDFKLFKDLVSPNLIVEILEKDYPIAQLKENPRTMIIENNEIFRLLFDLLHDSQSSYVDVAWDLINLLPKNTVLLEQIKTIGESSKQMVDWENVLDSKSIYKMLYTINIIKSFVFKELREDDKSRMIEDNVGRDDNMDVNVQWISNFKDNGGVNHLIQLIYQFELCHFDKLLGFGCLNDILKILLLFKSNDIHPHQLTKLLPKLCEIQLMILKSSSKRDNEKKYIELQTQYSRHRQKVLIQRLMNNNNDSNLDHFNDIDEVHPTINENWNNENSSIININRFVTSCFKIEVIIDSFMKEKVIIELLQFGLIIPKNHKAKYSIFNFFKEIISSNNTQMTKNLLKFIFEILFQFNTIHLAISNHNTSDAFFKILIFFLTSTDLSDICCFDQNFSNSTDIYRLIDFMVTFIKEFVGEAENVLIGFLSIIRIFVLENERILEYVCKKHNLLDILMNICLFSKCQNNSNSKLPTCVSQQSKEACFKLLSAICYNNPENLTEVIEKLTSFHKLGYWRSKRYYDWNISQLTEEKSSTGFVGLKNLGCICYMNSLMQQFFMIPTLRESILKSENEPLENQSESVLYQLKKIFSFLKASDRQYHNPKDFCSNFKTWEMQPINIYEQMDVDEFYNLLIDRLESSLKHSKDHNIFKDHFLGKLSNELICKGCPHYSEREETYFNLPLQVKNKKSIQESLEAFVQGEMLEGDNAYFCEKCDKKVNTLRRVCIKELPKHLIIVLKRFEFDYDTMQKIKVNDYCEFPKELNMEPYTQEYLSYLEKKREFLTKKEGNLEEEIIIEKLNKGEDYYKYDLSGVIIHTGFADSGHYYSIIKNSNNNNWYEFNDNHVRFYDVNDLHNEAFGGNNKQGKGQTGEKLTNAYVLFYKRKEEIDSEKKILVDEEIDFNHLNIQSDILELVKQDNYQNWVSKILFSNVYFEFIQDILVNYNTDISNNYFKTANLKNLSEHSIMREILLNRNIPESAYSVIKYNKENLTNSLNNQIILASPEFENLLFRFCSLSFFTTILRSREKNMVPNFMDIIKGFINKSHVNSDWLLEEFAHEEILFEYLIDCPIIEIKRLSAGVLTAALFKSYNHHKGNVTLECPLISFVSAIVFLVGKSNKHYSKDFSYIYFLLYRISKLSPEMSIYLNSKKVALFIILNMYNKHNLLQSTLRNLSNENLISSNFTLDCVINEQLNENKHREIYTRSIVTKEKLTPFEEFSEKKILEKLDKSPVQYESYLFLTLSEIMFNCPVFSEEERYLLKLDNKLTMKIFMSEIKSKQSSIIFSKLYAFACKESVEITNFVLNELIRVFEQNEFNELEHHSRLLINFLLVDDSLKEKRVTICMEKLFQVIKENSRFYKFTDYTIDFLIKSFVINYDFFKTYIPLWKKNLEFLIDWLTENPYPPIYYPSKTTVLFKHKIFQYANTEFKQNQVNAFINRQTLNANEKIQKLIEIKNLNEEMIKKIAPDNTFSNLDLTDFKFSVNDKVSIDNNIGRVISVLDEMIRVEFIDVTQNKKSADWFECNMSNLALNELYLHKENSEEKDLQI